MIFNLVCKSRSRNLRGGRSTGKWYGAGPFGSIGPTEMSRRCRRMVWGKVRSNPRRLCHYAEPCVHASGGVELRFIGNVVGGLFAVLVAKEPFACFAHIPNRRGVIPRVFEQSVADGARDSLRITLTAARARKERFP